MTMGCRPGCCQFKESLHMNTTCDVTARHPARWRRLQWVLGAVSTLALFVVGFSSAQPDISDVSPNASSASMMLNDGCDPVAPPALSPELTAALDAALDAARPGEVPGATAAILSSAGNWFGASGVSDLANHMPLQPHDRFEVGSITKTFIATTILQMVEEGLLALDDTLTVRLPAALTDLVPHAEDITIQHLLNHTSGVADYLNFLMAQARTDPTVFL